LTADARSAIEQDRREAFGLEESRRDQARRPGPDDRNESIGTGHPLPPSATPTGIAAIRASA
jgi:hypothetical protein